MPILGYEKWQTAEDVIARAARATVNSGQDVENHFTKVSKMVKIGSNTARKIADIPDPFNIPGSYGKQLKQQLRDKWL